MTPTYLTTDTHFGHMKLAEVFGDRPLDFQEIILARHSSLSREATLIHLGDFCIGNDEIQHERWNHATRHIQRRILVRGNHDNKSDSWYYAHGWDFVCSSFISKQFGRRVLFSHVPKDHTHYPTTDLNIHGHTHGNTHRDLDIQAFYDPTYHFELALEHTGYEPLLLTEKFLSMKTTPPQHNPTKDERGAE